MQETVLARKATVVYSTLSAPWLMFAEAATFYIQAQQAEDIDQRRLYQGLTNAFAYHEDRRTTDALGGFCATVLSIENTRREWAFQKPIQLLTLLRRFRSRQATDHRDKVFSLLGLVDRWMTIPLKIDYKMTKDELYIFTTLNVVEETQSLSILCDIDQVAERRPPLGGSTFQEPCQLSWVPDWSKVLADDGLESERSSRYGHYSAGRTHGLAYIHDNRMLETQGYLVAKVTRIAPSVPQDAIERLRQTILGWEEWWLQNTTRALGFERCGITDEDRSIFAETVCGNLLYNPKLGEILNARQDPYTVSGRDEIERAYKAWTTDTTAQRNRKTAIMADLIANSYKESEAVTQLKNSFYYSVRSATVSRRFFTFCPIGSVSGLSTNIGVGPPNLEVGDMIYIPDCSKVPLIIRPKASEQQRHSGFRARFIGKQDSLHEKRRLIGPGDKTSERCDKQHALHEMIGDAYVNGFMDSESVSRGQPQPATVYLV